MTVVSATNGADVRVTCDECGATTAIDGGGLSDRGLVYVAVTAKGWTGGPYARGPHRCAGCAAPGGSGPRRVPRPRARAAVGTAVSVAVTSPAAVVRATGDLDAAVVSTLRSSLESAVALRPHVIVDLTVVGEIDAVAVAATLAQARTAARRGDGELLLAAPPRVVEMLHRATHGRVVFRTFDTVPQAITAALAVPRAAPGPNAVTGRPDRRR
ncbi:hypothetical protein GCM10010172_85740 [Paractinoplanes ferrugineus]|uniref:STAS domain-containing protein n=1 Tax=Paractinoplanes ferrugineus TaxID=113564 RepID=A0A919J8Y5_9ACTN|nr:STAS domain-containing protein [Actinoplanes ferrugineus]GIE16720.1 hypothetical protein Afe05nite_85600 [Actinoplanes ferrugineus]